MSLPRADWSDSDLLDESDTLDLNTVEAEMLDSMMKWVYEMENPLTPNQRAWLNKLLDERGPNYGGDDE